MIYAKWLSAITEMPTAYTVQHLQQLHISRLQPFLDAHISTKLRRNWLVFRAVNPLESAYVNNLTGSPKQITLISKAAAIAFGPSNTSLELLSHVRNKCNYNQDVWRNKGVWTYRIQPPLPCVAQARVYHLHTAFPRLRGNVRYSQAWIITSFVYI